MKRITREQLMLFLIFFTGLLVRAVLYENEVFMRSDNVFLARLGKNLIENGRYFFSENYNMGIFFPPGFPALVGLVNLLVNDLFVSAKLVPLFAGQLTIILFYFIGKEIDNRQAGLFAAFAYAFHPLVLKYSVYGSTDIAFFFFLFLSVYIFLVTLRRDSFFMYTLLGISISLSYLIRPEGILLLLLPFLKLFDSSGIKSVLKKNIPRICMLLFTFILFTSPYLLFLKKSTGEFTLTGKSNVLLLLNKMSATKDYYEVLMKSSDNPNDQLIFSLNENKDQVVGFDWKEKKSFFYFVFSDPAGFTKRYVKNLLYEFRLLIKLVVPFLLPLFFAFFDRDLFRRRRTWIFLFFPLLYLGIYPFFIITERHVLLPALFPLLFSSAGFHNSVSVLTSLLDFYGIRGNKYCEFIAGQTKIIVIIVCVLSSFVFFKFSPVNTSPMPVEHIEAGHYIKNSISDEYERLNIMSRRPFVNFYSGSRFTMLPYAGSTDVINFAKLFKVDYIVIDERFLGKWEYYDELIEMDKYSDAIALVYENKSGQLLRLFKIKY